MQIGDIATSERVFTQEDVKRFGELTGDFNPVHFDEEYAKTTIFKRPIVHGPFVLTLITTIFAEQLPGPGSVYLAHDIRFLAPVYMGDKITARVEIIDITDKGHFLLKTECINQNDTVVISGNARIKKM